MRDSSAVSMYTTDVLALVNTPEVLEIVTWSNRLADDHMLELAQHWAGCQPTLHTTHVTAVHILSLADEDYTEAATEIGRMLEDVRPHEQAGAGIVRNSRHALTTVLRAAIVGSLPISAKPNILWPYGVHWNDHDIALRQEALLRPYQELRHLVEELRSQPELHAHIAALLAGWNGTSYELVDTARMLTST